MKPNQSEVAAAEYIICNHGYKKGNINLNGAKLIKGANEICTFKHLTEKGYYSNKPIIPDFDFVEIDECGQEVLVVTKETFEMLVEKYSGVVGKIFETEQQKQSAKNASRLLGWASAMYDPYDRG